MLQQFLCTQCETHSCPLLHTLFPAAGTSQQRASSSSSSTTSKVPAASTAAPIVLSEPLAAYVLTATRDYLRLYPISRAITGDRTVAKRVELHGRLKFASSFAANGAPALVCLIELEQEVHMQVNMEHMYCS
jgi:hypothetical protein